MSVSDFDAFKAELSGIKNILSGFQNKTVRDDELRERIRTLFRTWASVISPTIEPLLEERREFLKLGAELESLAKLTSKYKSVADYRKRLNKAIQLANTIVLYLPPSKGSKQITRATASEKIFINEIPDLPLRLVPNSLFGWKSQIESFVSKHPFDKSVFVMIRYRSRNDRLVQSIKNALKKHGFYGVLASDHKLTDDLYNPVACLLCCSKGIVVFDEAETNQTFNPNVAYELGMMHLLGRDCLILKHKTLNVLHSDILMKLYQTYHTVKQIENHINDWLGNDA